MSDAFPPSGPVASAGDTEHAASAAITPPVTLARSLGVLAHVDAELSIVIGRTRRSIDELLRVRRGSIIELEHRTGDPVEVVANGTTIARGDIVAIDGELGVRITEIVSDPEA